MTMDFERARFNMVEQQIRPWEVLDARVLETFQTVKREDYVPTRYRNLAFADTQIPLDDGQVMLKPIIDGRILQALQIRAEDSVLEVGTGSGFLTACLANLAREVLSLECRMGLAERARNRLEQNGVASVRIEIVDVMRGFTPRQCFDAIAITGAVFELPAQFRQWLKVGGRMFVVSGEAPVMDARLITRISETKFSDDSVFETDLPYLDHAAPEKSFSL